MTKGLAMMALTVGCVVVLATSILSTTSLAGSEATQSQSQVQEDPGADYLYEGHLVIPASSTIGEASFLGYFGNLYNSPLWMKQFRNALVRSGSSTLIYSQPYAPSSAVQERLEAEKLKRMEKKQGGAVKPGEPFDRKSLSEAEKGSGYFLPRGDRLYFVDPTSSDDHYRNARPISRTRYNRFSNTLRDPSRSSRGSRDNSRDADHPKNSRK